MDVASPNIVDRTMDRTTISTLAVLGHAETVKMRVCRELQQMQKDGMRFSITFDEVARMEAPRGGVIFCRAMLCIRGRVELFQREPP